MRQAIPAVVWAVALVLAVPCPGTIRNVVSGEERLYRRASDVVDEIVEARMLVGVHFRSADEDGAEIGRNIARQVARDWLRGNH